MIPYCSNSSYAWRGGYQGEQQANDFHFLLWKFIRQTRPIPPPPSFLSPSRRTVVSPDYSKRNNLFDEQVDLSLITAPGGGGCAGGKKLRSTQLEGGGGVGLLLSKRSFLLIQIFSYIHHYVPKGIPSKRIKKQILANSGQKKNNSMILKMIH